MHLRVNEDNTGAITWPTTLPLLLTPSTYLDIRHHLVRERFARKEFKVVHVASVFAARRLPDQTAAQGA